ncbi:MAG: hypothetical protein LBS84_07470 [Clostridiales bacterium]|nr:hypothetical protein [Clostridiales bacterium]
MFSITENYFGQENPDQKLVSARFEELAAAWIVSAPSYRNVSEALNRFRLEGEGGVTATWLRDNIEKQGRKISEALHEQAEFVLEANGFKNDGHLQEGTVIEAAIIIEEEEFKTKAATREEAVKEAAAKLRLEGEIKEWDYD